MMEDEEYNLDVVQKRWYHGKRAVSSISFFGKQEGNANGKDLRQISGLKWKVITNYTEGFRKKSTGEDFAPPKNKQDFILQSVKLDASEIGDFPVQYTIHSLQNHQYPTTGVYIDRRIIPGFKYLVQKLPGQRQSKFKTKYLFHSKSLTLLSISRGYGRCFTFERNRSFPHEENYFYSDNHYGGYAFELQVISDGDTFTIYDANHEPQGVLNVISVDFKQIETDLLHRSDEIERRVRVKFAAKVEFYDTVVSQEIPLNGVAICIKRKSQSFSITTKVLDVLIRNHKYYLVQGYHEDCRRSYVKGDDIGDVPTKYTITGLLPYEMPVIGTYIDPRILPGFHYKVRLSNRKKWLFNSKPLRLQSIGVGYGKKLTFETDPQTGAGNFLWSDSNQDGLAFEIRAVLVGMRFLIELENQILGEATVFRTDSPQIEARMEKLELATEQFSYVKYVHVDVMCYIRLGMNDRGTHEDDENLVRIYGLAIVRKDPGRRNGYLERLENVGLDSHLNLVFAQTRKGLTFIPIS